MDGFYSLSLPQNSGDRRNDYFRSNNPLVIVPSVTGLSVTGLSVTGLSVRCGVKGIDGNGPKEDAQKI
jgi:hypothetical protein